MMKLMSRPSQAAAIIVASSAPIASATQDASGATPAPDASNADPAAPPPAGSDGSTTDGSGNSNLMKRAVAAAKPAAKPAILAAVKPGTQVKDLSKDQKAVYIKLMAAKLASTLPPASKDGLTPAQVQFMAANKKGRK